MSYKYIKERNDAIMYLWNYTPNNISKITEIFGIERETVKTVINKKYKGRA